jgi:Flp pilus assembly secretin CpaC
MKYKTAQPLDLNRGRTTAFLTVLLSIACGMVLSGCGDFFNTKPTELESRVVLDELSQVRESQHIANPLPEVYRQPPSRVTIAGGVKLFYFTRHLPVKQLADLTAQQLKLKIAQNPATNQLVVYCANDAEADVAEQYLEMIDVPPVQVNIDCLILERFGDVTMDWATTLFVQNFLGEEITLGEKTGGTTPAFPGAELRETKRGDFGLDIGYWLNRNKDGHKVRTVVDLLVSRGYLKVLLNPQLETINGQKATVTIKDFAPIEKMATGSGYNDVYNITEYIWVENTLTVTPHVFADGSIGLTTSIKVGSRSKPEGVVQNPIITERSINVEENRIERGKSLIIGGMRKSEKRDVIRGAPFFKDLPIIGVLFSSRDFEEKGTEIIFILTPSISGGSRDHKEVVGEIRTRYADPDIKTGIRETLKDPLGSTTYASIVEKEAVQAEMDRVNSELLRQQAENRAAAEKQLADGASKEAARLRLEAQKLQAQAEKEMAEAQKMTQQAQAAQTAKETEKAKAAELEVQRQKAQLEAQNARAAADAAQNAALTAAQKAAAQEARASKAIEDAMKAQAAARQATEEAAEKARKAEAERRARLEAEQKAREEAAQKAAEAEKARKEAELKAQQEAQAAAAAAAQAQQPAPAQPAPQPAAPQPQPAAPEQQPAATQPTPAPTPAPAPVTPQTPPAPSAVPADPNTPAS